MAQRRYKTFTGGIDLADEKQATLNSAIAVWPTPSCLLVPLATARRPDCAARLIHRPGQHVQAGQVIAAGSADEQISDVIAPLSGMIGEVVTAGVAGRDEFVTVPAVRMTDLMPATQKPAASEFDWRSSSPAALRKRIAEGALPMMARTGLALADWIERARAKNCHILIANAMECQPYATSEHRLLVEHGSDVIRGLAMLAVALEATQTILAVDHRRTDDYRSLHGPANAYHVSRVALSHKYPTGVDAMLASILTGVEVPFGGTVLDLGAAVVHPATCLALYQWIACGIAPTGRVLTLSGERMKKAGNYWVPLGTRIAELVASVHPPWVHGGPMVGMYCGDDAVVTAATDAVLALDRSSAMRPGPCIRCGWCTDHCPARLNVAALNDMYELSQLDKARRRGVTACLECGVCSYVCPSRLPLTARVKQIKRSLRLPFAAAGEEAGR